MKFEQFKKEVLKLNKNFEWVRKEPDYLTLIEKIDVGNKEIDKVSDFMVSSVIDWTGNFEYLKHELELKWRKND